MKANSSICSEKTADTSISEDENDRSSNTLLHNYYPLEEEGEGETEEENHDEKDHNWMKKKGKMLDRSWHSSTPSLIDADTKSAVTAPLSFDHLTNDDALRLHQEMLMKWRMEHHLAVNPSKDESHFYFNEVAMTSDEVNEDDSRLIDIKNKENSPSQTDELEEDDLKKSQVDVKKTRKENFKNKIQRRLLKRSSKSHDRGTNDVKNNLEISSSSSNSSSPILSQSDSSYQNSPEKGKEGASEEGSNNSYCYFELSPCTSEISSKPPVPVGTEEIVTCLKNMERKATMKNPSPITNNDDDDKPNVKAQHRDLNKNDKSFASDQASLLPPIPPTDEPKTQRSSKKKTSNKKMTKSKNATCGDNADVTSKGKRIKSPVKSTLYCDNEAFLRLSRQSRRGSFRQKRSNRKQTNYVRLHIYDLLASETYVEFPWGCSFPIGKCLNVVNTGLHALGTGAYHCGIEVNGVEYAFGANQIPGLSGVFTCEPMKSPGYEYRTTLDFGERYSTRKFWITVPKSEYITKIIAKKKSSSGQENDQTKDDDSYHKNKSNKAMDFAYRQINLNVNGLQIMREMAGEYMGVDYDLLRKNCCTFARDACLRLGVEEIEIPTWFMNIAEAGAQTEDTIASMEKAMFTPIHKIMSCNKEENKKRTEHLESGFEVIVRNTGSGKKCFHIIESNVTRLKTKSKLKSEDQQEGDDVSVGVRETLSWTY